MAFRSRIINLAGSIKRYNNLSINVKQVPVQVYRNYASFQSSPVYDPNNKIDYEISKNPEEWKYVSRLLPQKIIPQPQQKETFASGWTPQKESAFKLPYFVRRSKNHMPPVYLDISYRGVRKLTYIKNIKGDIWLFEEDIRAHLQHLNRKSIGIRVDEVGCKIIIRGDFVNQVLEWFLKKGL